jgi:SulP family sulfate permease
LSGLLYVESPLESWKLYDISLVQWELLPRQAFSLIAMFLVVAFSSSLDIAAIEMELGTIPFLYPTCSSY